MRGKLIEDLLYVQAVPAAQRITAGTLYNGEAVSVSNNGIDTKDCDEINFVINAGTFVGAVTLDVQIVQSNTNNPTGATLVTGNASPNDTANTPASFTQMSTVNDAQIHKGSIKCKNFNRYMWVRSYQSGSTTNYSVLAILGKCDRDPQANSPTFDLNY